MKKTSKAALAFISISLLGSSPGLGQNIAITKPESVGMSSARLENLTRALQAEVDNGHIPGAVVMINRRGKLVYSQALGYQDKHAHRPMKTDAVFRIFSMIKPIIAVATMILVEEGKLVLADPVSKYLPEFANMKVCNAGKNDDGTTVCTLVPAESPITLQDLLRHTSGIGYGETTTNSVIKQAYSDAGLYDAGSSEYNQPRVLHSQELKGLAKAPLSSQPGTNWEYGISMELMGRIIEVASGQPLATFLDQHIWAPLNMTDTGFYVPPGKLSRLAQPFEVDPFTNTPISMLEVTQVPNDDGTGGSVVSSAPDYLNFVQMLLNGGRLKGHRIVSPMTITLMTSDQLGNRTTVPLSPGRLMMGVDGYTFGLGFMVRQGSGLASVPGSPGEYMWSGVGGTLFWVDPREQLAVVVMAQVPGKVRGYYRRLIKGMVSAAVTNDR
jgi:CubicO group peptidase (beta-lactamase class C family)